MYAPGMLEKSVRAKLLRTRAGDELMKAILGRTVRPHKKRDVRIDRKSPSTCASIHIS